MKLSDAVRRHRILAGMQQNDLAAAVGVSRQTIGSIEKGATEPRWSLVKKLALRLGFSLDSLSV